jgi:hypothetical protein
MTDDSANHRREAIALRDPASRKPSVAILGNPRNACVTPVAAAGETPVSHAPG